MNWSLHRELCMYVHDNIQDKGMGKGSANLMTVMLLV